MNRVWRYLRNPSFIAFFVFVVLSILYCHPIFKNITNWGIYDWDQHFSYHEVPRETLLTYHQFPFWNPYNCGGNVMLANMQARFAELQTELSSVIPGMSTFIPDTFLPVRYDIVLNAFETEGLWAP